MPSAALTRSSNPVSDARRCAYRVVRRVEADGAYADRAFRAEADRVELMRRDRAFAQQLAYGTIQRRMTLDHVIERLSSRPPVDIDPPALDALRLGVFQVAFMSSVPDHASVGQTVELAKLEARSAHGFVNAVMRRAAREAAVIVAALGEATPEEAALRHSHPRWVAQMWWDVLGAEQTCRLLACDNETPESAVRANALRVTPVELERELTRAGAVTRPAEWPAEALILETPFDVHGSPLFEAGALMPQSRGSMLVAHILAPRAGERVLDMCAAPGAKTTQISALMGDEGEVTAIEQHSGRARALEEHCLRLGAANVAVIHADATKPLEGAPFDRVLLDPPCSNLGTLRSRPDARWRRSLADLSALGQTQQTLLKAAAAAVRPGGTLVYSTCTISPSENEDRIAAFLKSHPDFCADDLAAVHPMLASSADSRFLQLLPHRDATDGFFVARLRRRAPSR